MTAPLFQLSCKGDGGTGLSLGGLAGSFKEANGTGLSSGVIKTEEEDDDDEMNGDRRRSSIGVLEHAVLNETLLEYGIDDKEQ